MNYKKLGKILGKIMMVEGVLMCAPLAVSFVYKEAFMNKLAYIIPIALLLILGVLMQIPKEFLYLLLLDG